MRRCEDCEHAAEADKFLALGKDGSRPADYLIAVGILAQAEALMALNDTIREVLDGDDGED